MLRTCNGQVPNNQAAEHSFAARSSHEESMTVHMNAKLPPIFDGRVSWFRYEEAVDDCDAPVTQLMYRKQKKKKKPTRVPPCLPAEESQGCFARHS